MLQHLRVFSEYASPAAPIVQPLVRIDMWHPKHMGFYGAVRMMKQRLAEQVGQLQARPEGERAVMLWWLLAYELYPSKGADPLAIFERGVVPTQKSIAMLRPLSEELKKRRIPIDLIFMDNEGGFGFFEIGQAKIRRIMRSARAKRRMPPEVRALNVNHLQHGHPNFANAGRVWTEYANKLKFDAIKKVVTGAGLFDIRPSRRAQPQSPSSVNFWSVKPTWPIYDYNGWELRDTSIDGRSSGPSCYVGTPGGRYANRVHHWIWNDLINILNQVRSCLAAPGRVVHPVISHPWLCHPWIYEQMIAHMVRTGINWSQNKCAFLYWNAHNPNLNDPIVADIMQRHDLAYPLQRNLPEIPLDTDQIVTGDYVTTYGQFLANMASVIGPG